MIMPYQIEFEYCSDQTLEPADDPWSKYMMYDGLGNAIGIRMVDDEELTDLNVQSLDGVFRIDSISHRQCPETQYSIISFFCWRVS